MTKTYYFFGEWRKKDIDFLNSLGLDRDVELGADSFSIREGEIYSKIIDHFSKKKPLFGKVRPEGYICRPSTTLFSKQDLDESPYFWLRGAAVHITGFSPYDAKYEDMFDFECSECRTARKQLQHYRFSEPKLGKKNAAFVLHYQDDLFFKKDFYEKVLHPYGVGCQDYIVAATGKVSESYVQLELPIAKSPLHIEGTAYDTEEHCGTCGRKQYSIQILDFFPPFKESFDFHLCKTQEMFGGSQRVMISRELTERLLEEKVLKYVDYQLVPIASI